MANNVFGVTDIVGTSESSIVDAIDNAIHTASGTLRNLEWFEVGEIRGRLDEGKVSEYQVVLKLGFRYEKKG